MSGAYACLECRLGQENQFNVTKERWRSIGIAEEKEVVICMRCSQSFRVDGARLQHTTNMVLELMYSIASEGACYD